MKMSAIQTKYGVLYGRNALILTDAKLTFYPWELRLTTSLSLSACKPAIMNRDNVIVGFIFRDIESLSIFKTDDYPYEKYTSSCFDMVIGECKNENERIVLSTYGQVFDIVGKYLVTYT
ncbi:hypothetical protein ACR9H8_18410 [Kosakonia cowanii]